MAFLHLVIYFFFIEFEKSLFEMFLFQFCGKKLFSQISENESQHSWTKKIVVMNLKITKNWCFRYYRKFYHDNATI